MKNKTDKVLDMSSGVINMALAIVGIYVIFFARSDAVSAWFAVIGIIGFGSMFMYGVNKSVTASDYDV